MDVILSHGRTQTEDQDLVNLRHDLSTKRKESREFHFVDFIEFVKGETFYCQSHQLINIVRDHQKAHDKILKEKTGLTTYVTMTNDIQTKHLELCVVCHKNQFLDECESITEANRGNQLSWMFRK